MTKKYRKMLKIKMIEAGFKNVELSETTGIPTYTLSQIVTGRVNPTAEEASLISRALKIPAKELFRAE